MLRASQSASCQNRVAHTYRYRDKESDFLFFLAGFFWPKQWRARSAAWQMKWRRKSKKPLKVNFFYDCYCRLLLVGVFFRFWFLVLALAATCAFYLRFVYCLPMIDERISFQVLVFCRLPVCMDASWAHIQFGVEWIFIRLRSETKKGLKQLKCINNSMTTTAYKIIKLFPIWLGTFIYMWVLHILL